MTPSPRHETITSAVRQQCRQMSSTSNHPDQHPCFPAGTARPPTPINKWHTVPNGPPLSPGPRQWRDTFRRDAWPGFSPRGSAARGDTYDSIFLSIGSRGAAAENRPTSAAGEEKSGGGVKAGLGGEDEGDGMAEVSYPNQKRENHNHCLAEYFRWMQ
ncbi:hypothetical protein E2C01_003495 [Portunus trituberculatus]|uniref:Uncharacterized protein n=1 Tax=Portunus trituberculatus TaxID=210409 RepID=A0A5B7CMC2_PORTR|nr:hypothetical protein [Portunus trituberculatus]